MEPSLTCLALIDQLIAKLTDWRGKTFASIRNSILEADRETVEQSKWTGGPLWPHDGMIAVGNAHKDKDKVKLTFSHGGASQILTSSSTRVLKATRGELSSRNMPDSLPWHQIFESSDSLSSFLHREPRLDPSLLSIGIVCDIRVAHGRQFTGGVFAGVSMTV